jgi:hypothetical protein
MSFGQQRTFPQLGCNEDFMGSLGLFAVPRKLGHCAKEAAGTLGRRNLGKFLGNLAIEGKLLGLGKAQVAKAVVELHELGLFLSGGNLDVFSFLEVRGGVIGEGPLSNGCRQILFLRRHW